MKNVTKSSLFALCFLFIIACNRPTDSNLNENLLTKSDSIQIVNKIIEITDNFANANNKLDAKGILNYGDYYNPDFIYIENTSIHPSGEELENGVSEFYGAGIDSTFFNWTKRDIIPLSKEYAHLIGEYNFYLKLKTGEVSNFHVFYSGLYKKIDGNWKALRLHESYKSN